MVVNPLKVCHPIIIDVGMLSHQQSRNEIAGKKALILNPTADQKNGTEVTTFAEGVHHPSLCMLTTGNLLFGYSCVNWGWSRTSHELAYHDFWKDRFDVSSQIEEFPGSAQRDPEKVWRVPVLRQRLGR